jgi:ankyrin repeat protein
MRANRLSQFSGKSDAWLGEDGFTDEERGRQLRTRAFPSIGSANHLVPEQHELLLSEEQTLGNIAFCGNYHDLTDYFNRKNESRMEPHKPIQDIVPHVLEKAVEGGQSEIVRWLLTQKDVRPQPYAFRLAAAQGSPGVMETLIEHASTEYEGPSPLHLAAEYGNVNVVKMLVTRDKEWRMFDKICSIEKSPLDLAVMEGFPVVVDLLLDHIRTSPKAGERYDDALGIALRARETEKKNEDSDSERKSDRQVVLDHLTERALDFHLTERALGLHLTERPLGKPDPLHDVVDAGNEVLLDCILGAKVDQRNLDLMKKLERCLISAASFGHTNILQRLLDFGVPPQPQISKGATALIQACIQGHHEAVRLLIRHKAQPLTPWRGLTSFHWTVKKGHLKIVRFFLDRGILGLPAADTSKPVNTNLSLLHLAVSSKKTEIVRAILKFGVSTEVRDGHEETALHAAVRRSNEGIVKLLLEHHADVHARNNKGQTSFDVAARKGNTGICKLLIAAGAKVEIDQGTLVNAVKNRRFYGEFIEMLLEYAKVDDVSGIISASFQRRSCEMTKWLLKRTSLSVNSLDPVWFDRIAARYEVEDLKWFVKRFGNFTPTRRTITAAAMNTVDGANMMRYILSHHGDNGRRLLDSETLRYAVSNQIFGDEISLIVLDKGPIAISELALGEAVQNSRMGPQLLELLNQKAKGPKRISGQTIRKMADNWQLSETMFNTYVHLAVPYQGFDMDAKFEIMGLLDFDTLKILLSNYGRYVEPKSLATVEKQQLILGAVRNKQCAPRIVQYLQREMNVCLGQVPGMLQQMVENEKHAASLVMLLVEEATSYPHKADVLTSEDIHLILSTMDGTTIETVLKKVGHKLVFGLTTIRAALMNPKYRSTTYESLKNVRGFHETYVDEQALILASRCGQDGLETTKHITKEYLKEICSTNLLEAATQNEELAEFLRDMFTSEVFKTRVITAVLQNWRTSGMLLEKLSAYELQEPRIVWDDAAALGAIQQMDSGTIAKLMRSKDKPSLKVMEAAASNWAHGVEVVELLMEAPYSALAEYSSVPKEIVRAAAANWKCGLSILESLKTTYRKTLTVTASVLEAAAGNPRHGMQMMVFLLKAGDIGDITPSVLVSAAANIGCGARMTRTLLSEVGARAKHLITQKVLNTAAGNGCCGVSVLKELVKHEGIELNETLLRSAFSNATSGIMCMAIGLQQSIGQPRTTVKPRKMFKNGVPLIEHTFQAAIGGAIYRLDAKPILVGRERKASYNLDVQWTGIDQVYIPQSRVRIEHEWKWDDGSAVVSYLLDKKPSLVQVAHAATAAYSGNLSIVQEFLRRGVVPTDKMLYEAVQNTSHGYQLATLLLRNNPQLPITDKLLLRAATNSIFSDALLPLLLRSDFDRCLPKQVISECAVGDIATEMLLARQDPLGNEGGCKWPDVKHAAVRGIRGDNGLEIADWFWRRFGPDVAIATDILTAATSSASPLAPAICQMVFRWTDASDIPIPDVLFASAAANLLHSERILRLLMEQAYRRSVTPKLGPVLMATIKNGRSGLATLQWLLRTHFRHGSPTGLQDDDILAALRAAAGNSTHSIPIMTLLLKSFPQLVEDRIVRNNFDANRILQAAATNPSCSDAALGLLLEYIGPIRVSPSVLEAAVANASCSPEMVGKLRSLQPPQNPEGRLAEAIWVAACRNVRHAKQILSDVLKGPSYVSSNMVRAANTNTGSGIAVLKLLREWHARPDTGDGFLITRELLNNIGEHAIFDAGLGDTAQDGQNVPISLHGAALRALESDTLRDLIRSDHQLYIAEPPKNNDDYLPVSILRQIVDADHVHVHPMFLEWMKNCEDKTVARKADQRLSKATEKGYHAPVVASTSFPRHPVDLDVNTQPAITDPEQYEKLLSFFDTNPRSVRLDPLRDFLRRHNVQSIKPMLLERASKDVDCLQFLLTSFPPAYTEGVVTTSTLINATSSIPTLRLLLKTMPLKRIGTAVLEEVADNLEALQVLFEAVHPRIPRIEESVLLAAADDEEALRFLIAHSKYSQVSEALLMAAAGTPETTKMLLELDPEADVTENVLKHAVGNIKVMELLLAPRKDQETDVTEEVLIAAAESSLPVTMLLVDRVSCFPVFRLLEKSNAEVTKWILERSPGVLITNATWRSAFSELGKMRILLEHDNTFSVARFLRCCSEYSGYYSWHRFPQLTVFEEIARQPKFRIEQHDIIPLACAQKEGPSYYSKNRFWKTILDHNPGFIQDHDFLFQFIAFKLDLTPLVEALQESYCNPIHVPRGVQDMAKAVDGTSSNLPGSKCSLFSVFQYSSIFILETNQRKESCQETSGYGVSSNHTTTETNVSTSTFLTCQQDPSMNLSAPMEDLHEAEDEPGLDTDHGSDTLSSDALSSNCSIASDHSQAGFGIHTTYQVDMTKCETHFDPRENSHFA